MIQITPFKQTDDSRCGAACLKMIFSYYNKEVSEQVLCDTMGLTYANGCTDIQMKATAELYGFNCYIKNNSSIEDLKYWTDNHIPVIVDWFCPGYLEDPSSMPNGHSSIVVEVDTDYVYLLDPALDVIRPILHADFMRVWFDWRHDPYIQKWEDLVLRQMMIILPSKLTLLKEKIPI